MKLIDQEMIEAVSKLPLLDFEIALSQAKNEDDYAVLVIARGATDFDWWCRRFFPHYCKKPWNEFHRDYIASLEFGERNRRRVWGAPRGSAKSTVASLLKPIHDVCYGLETFIIIISNTAPLAEQKLRAIRDAILKNGPLRAIYGLRFDTSTPGTTKFRVTNGDGEGCYFMAFGKGAQVRGARDDEHRPSKLLLDDAEHSDEVDNEALRLKDETWFTEDVSKLGDENTNIEIVGTILHNESLLAKTLKNPVYRGQVYKSVIAWAERQDLWDQWRATFTNLDNSLRLTESDAFYHANEAEMLKGTAVLWPEKEPYLYLMKELIEIGKSAFWKEKQNQPLGAKDKTFPEMHFYEETPEGLLILKPGGQSALVYWSELRHNGGAAIDPATGKEKPKKGNPGDFSCMLAGYYHDRSGRLFVHWDSTERQPPSKFIREILMAWERLRFNRLGVETNLYRDLLMDNIKDERTALQKELRNPQYAAGLKFYEITQTENKRERITRLEPKVTHGWILFNKKLSRTFFRMMEDFPFGDHDDGPDCLEMLWRVFNKTYLPGGVNTSPHR